jgi:DNA-binding CsgD family transcriptional regulator
VKSDWIGFVESAYALEPDLDDWLGGLAERAAPLLEQGFGLTALAFRLEPGRVAIEGAGAFGGPAGLREMALATNLGAPNPAMDLVYRASVPVGTLSEVLAERAEMLAIVRETSGGAFEDTLGMVAHAGAGRGVAITTPLAKARRMSESERARWRRAALHIAAAHRLRLALGSLALEAPSVEAVLDASGHVADARAGGRSADAREALREAVRRSEQARGALRRDPDAALDLWEALVLGRWSLVDHFESDGRRFVVAHRNEPGGDDPRGLTPRERDSAELLGRGYAPKEIAYALGLARSTIDGALGRARNKLAVDSVAELAAFFAPGGLRARIAELEVAGESLLVGALPALDVARLAGLSEAERDVAIALVRGATNREIAKRRGGAERTIANQVQSLFRKLAVHSRAELAAHLLRDVSAAR